MTDSKPPATLESVVAARIAPIIGEMIPEETIRLAVKAMLHAFMEVPNHSTHRTPIQELIYQDMIVRAKDIISTELNKQEYQTIWTNNGQRPGKVVEEVLKSMTEELVAGLFGNVASNIISYMRNNMQQMLRGY